MAFSGPQQAKLTARVVAPDEADIRDGFTALMLAANYGDVEAARLLVASGANVGAEDNGGRTAADMAN